MTELLHAKSEPLRQDGEFLLSRGQPQSRSEGLPFAILVLAPVGDHPTPVTLRKLEHEYALREELDPAWAVRPLALAQHQGRTVLLLEDPGGEPLDRLLGPPMEVPQFLRVAIGLASALGQLHARGLIHKDVKPGNILVNAATGQVWLTGFGIASRLPRERQAPTPPEVIAGTLAYMAPEQTGRMNRSLDARSDLYSLGVTLYEILTGSLPFSASDPMEWIHCHIARLPVPPTERRSGVPAPLSAIIMKLLAKAAEDRYQTAAGVEADLRECLAAWETQRRIDAFPLGAHDIPDQLLIPEKLYGREAEIDALVAAFDRVVTHGTKELVLVSGYSGIGKSSIVNELHKVLVPPRGLFAAGKFDQYKRDIPYATLAQVFQSLVRQLLSEDDAELNRWQQALLEALGPNGQLMVNLVPELVLIIGEQPPVPDLPPQDRQTRFQTVFRRFLGVFARPEHPLALFLDDLQWLDTATLDLLEHLVTHPEVRHLMVIGAYRDNEVSPSHPLMRTLGVIRDAREKVQEIMLVPLKPDHVGQLVADSLHCDRVIVQPLAQLMHEKTGGNPFFAIQFFMALAEEALLTFDHDAAAWTWDLARIRAKGFTENVVDLMATKLSRLPEATRDALGQLACLGNVAEVATLAVVHGESEEKIHATLRDAVEAGLILCTNDSYAFFHDRVQEAAYALIPAAERAAAHLRIGRVLLSRTSPAELEDKIFEIVNQFDRGVALIRSHEEGAQVAELNLIAGKRAKTSAAYAAAQEYFAAGRALLGEDSWERRYELTFDLELHWAECEFVASEVSAAEERLAVLSARAANLSHQADVVCLAVLLFFTTGRSERAVETGLEFLQRVGIAWSSHPTDEEVRQEYQRMHSQLAGRPIDTLIGLPAMVDPACVASMNVLSGIFPAASSFDKNLLELVLLRMVNLSLEYGNGDGSSVAYAALNMVLGPRFGDYQTAYRFGQLACQLVDKSGLDLFKARVYSCFGSFAMAWTEHLPACRPLLRLAFDVGNAIGDLGFAAFTFRHLITNLLISGVPLGDVQREAEQALAFARKARLGLSAERFIGQLALIRALRGVAPDAPSPDNGHSERWPPQHVEEQPHLAMVVCFYWIFTLEERFFAQDYAAGIEAITQIDGILWSTRSCFEEADYHFYAALTRAAACARDSSEQRERHLQALTNHNRQIAVWAEQCPENFANRAALIGAEMARLEGRELDAERLYEEAIRLARERGFVQNEGLANELAARFYAGRGFETIAHAYLRNARFCYLRWGADGKVRQLEQRHPHLREEPAPPRATSTIGTSIEQLDLATIVKVSQAVSGEIVLDKLIQTLMVIALEHAGAERGLLLLPRGDELRIEAEAATGRDAIEVLLRPAAVLHSALPESILRYVLRSHDSVLLEDAAAPNQFSADEYIRHRPPRSVLCLPLVKQSKLIGVLYLENHLTSHVFTPARIAVLKLLASQAAISLENARLYTDVQQENHERKQAEERVQRSEAYLAEAQRLSLTGSFGWHVSSGAIVWSDETYRLFGIDRTTTPTVDLFLQRVHPDDVVFVQETLAHASRGGTDLNFECRFMLPGGTIKAVHVVGHAVRDAVGELEFVGAVMDVTLTKRAEALLAAEKRLLEMIAKGNSLPLTLDALCRLVEELSKGSLSSILLLDPDGNRLRHGAAPSLPKSYTDAIDGGLIGPAAGSCGTAAYRKEPVIVSDIAQDPLWADYRDLALVHGLRACWSTPILASDGRVLGTFAIYSREPRIPTPQQQNILEQMTDLASIAIERKRAEEEHQGHLWFLESMDRVNRAIQGTNDLEQMMSDVLDAVLSIFDCDRAWLVYPCDPEAASWKVSMEHARPEFPGAFALGVELPVDPDIAKIFQTVRTASGPVRFGPGSDHPLPPEAAKRFSIQSILTTALYPKGDKSYMLGLHQCSYQRIWTPQEERLFQEIGRRLEDALTSLLMFRNLGESERKLEEAQRISHVGHWERDLAADRYTWSDETYRIFGLQPQQRSLSYDDVQELLHPADRQPSAASVTEALQGRRRYDVEYRAVRPDGEVRFVRSQAEVVREESGRPRRVFGTVQDITERKRAEHRLIAQHMVTQILAEAASFEEATPKILRAVCECLVWDVGALWHVDREAGVLHCVEIWHKESIEVPEFEAISRENAFMPGIGLPGRVWFSREPAYIPDVVRDANFPRAPVAAREVLHAAFGFPILLGGEVLGVMEFFSHEIRQPDQELLNLMAMIGSQIGQFTERKRAEDALHHAQLELTHVTRVATLGELTASIAHEINQPLGAVVNSASACLRWLDAHKLEEARRSVARVIAEGHRASEIISRVRALAKKAPPRKDWLDVNETIQEIIALAHSEVQRNDVALEMQLSDDVPVILADRIQLQQVILNLLVNAIEAMSVAGEDPRELVVRSGTDEAQSVLVAVRDSGPGLDPQSLERLFDAFYTTKPHGLGMGLAISRSIVEAHGGRLWATANVPRGAIFQFTLPIGGERVT